VTLQILLGGGDRSQFRTPGSSLIATINASNGAIQVMRLAHTAAGVYATAEHPVGAACKGMATKAAMESAGTRLEY
jgi:hypothetical protein